MGSSLGCADARGSGGDILWEQWLVTFSSCSCPLPSTDLTTELGSMGRENPRVVGFPSDSVSSGERQLLADYFMVSF